MNVTPPMECPNCGSSDFAKIEETTDRCAYCGTVFKSPALAPRPVIRCLRCGFDNDPGNIRCSQCGTVLSSQPQKKKTPSPATASILVTILGSMFIWIAGPIVGLILGYKALNDAREGGSLAEEKQARTAVIIGWIFIGLNLLFICMTLAMSGMQTGIGICGALIQEMSNALPGVEGLLP